MDTMELCAKWTPLIIAAVALIKRLPLGSLIVKNPKWVAAVLGIVTAVIPMLRGTGLTAVRLAVCIVTAAAAPVGVHQLFVKPITDKFAD